MRFCLVFKRTSSSYNDTHFVMNTSKDTSVKNTFPPHGGESKRPPPPSLSHLSLSLSLSLSLFQSQPRSILRNTKAPFFSLNPKPQSLFVEGNFKTKKCATKRARRRCGERGGRALARGVLTTTTTPRDALLRACFSSSTSLRKRATGTPRPSREPSRSDF